MARSGHATPSACSTRQASSTTPRGVRRGSRRHARSVAVGSPRSFLLPTPCPPGALCSAVLRDGAWHHASHRPPARPPAPRPPKTTTRPVPGPSAAPKLRGMPAEHGVQTPGGCSTASQHVYLEYTLRGLGTAVVPTAAKEQARTPLARGALPHAPSCPPDLPEPRHGRLASAVRSWTAGAAPRRRPNVAGPTAFPLTNALRPSRPRTVACPRHHTAALMGNQGAARGALRARTWCRARGARGTLNPQASMRETFSYTNAKSLGPFFPP